MFACPFFFFRSFFDLLCAFPLPFPLLPTFLLSSFHSFRPSLLRCFLPWNLLSFVDQLLHYFVASLFPSVLLVAVFDFFYDMLHLGFLIYASLMLGWCEVTKVTEIDQADQFPLLWLHSGLRGLPRPWWTLQNLPCCAALVAYSAALGNVFFLRHLVTIWPVESSTPEQQHVLSVQIGSTSLIVC